MALRNQSLRNEKLEKLLKKRRAFQEEQLDSRIEDLREISEKFNSNMQQVVNFANELNVLMKTVSGAAQETNRAVDLNMGSLKNMEQFSDRLIEKMGEGVETAKKMKGEVLVGMGFIKEMEKMVAEAAKYSEEGEKSVADLKEEAQEIKGIVALVKNIADETNLLALNAAIEASRAGEHGRGFAVVADEVRSLAEFSEQTTHRINSAIANSLDYLNKTIEGVNIFKNAASNNHRKALIIIESFDVISDVMDNVISFMIKMKENGIVIRELAENSTKEGEEIAGATEQISASSEETTRSTMEEEGAIKSIDGESEQILGILSEMDLNSDSDEITEMAKANLDTVSAAVEEVNSSSFEIKKAIEEISSGAQLINESLRTLEGKIDKIDSFNEDGIEIMEGVFKQRARFMKAIERIKTIDHEIFVDALEKAINNREKFWGQLDPVKCSFGQWYNNYQPKGDDEAASYKVIKPFHDMIHLETGKIVNLMEEGQYDEALSIFNDVREASRQFNEAFEGWAMKDGMAFIVLGIKNSKNLNNEILVRMIELKGSFNEIFKVVDVISRVTIQINMLAVNGAIEAARAGEYGRGFAVVAGDIRNMAKESEKNSNAIKDMLELISEKIEEIQRKFEGVEGIIIKQNERAEASIDALLRIFDDASGMDKAAGDGIEAQNELKVAIESVKEGNRLIDKELDNLLKSREPAEECISKQLEDLEKSTHILNEEISLFEDITTLSDE